MKKSMYALPINTEKPRVMHIDLNSCFATIEAQANRLIRNRPIGVAAYDTPRGFVIAANYIAKAKGVKLGVNVAEARQLAPGIVIMTPDPAKYRDAHQKFKQLLLEYTDDVHPKSIDEFVLNFAGSPALRESRFKNSDFRITMQNIALEIKEKIKERLGEAVTVNVGIGPNRFLAKYAAGFNKPDGLTLIDSDNLLDFYKNQDLVDLPGINVRYRRRLFMAGIATPLEFLAADRWVLQKQVFKSIVGYYWYLRLRGYEIDAAESKRGSIGHQYALSNKTADVDELKKLLIKLCEKTGRRLRKNELYAQGIHLYLGFAQAQNGSPRTKFDGQAITNAEYQRPNYHDRDELPASFENIHRLRAWKMGMKVDCRLNSTGDIYRAACHLLDRAVIYDKVKLISVTVFNLQPWDPEQLELFEESRSLRAGRRVSQAMDSVNNRYGEFVVTPASMMDMSGTILDRIAFGQVRDM